MRAKGFVSIVNICDGEGKIISPQKAVDYGWVKPSRQGRGWGLDRSEIPLGENLFVDSGRQSLAYCFGFRAPITNFVVQQFSVGTGTTPPAVTDVTLVNPISLPSGFYKPINGVDFPSPFVARVEFTLGASDANGYLITELGLFSGDTTMFCRKTITGLNKTSDFSPTIAWRVRF